MADVDTACASAASAGASVLEPPTEYGQVGRAAVICILVLIFAGLVNGNVFLTIQPPRGYLEQIDKVLEEGPQKANAKATKNPHESRIEYKDSDRFEVWYFYGCFDKEDLEAADVEVEKDQEYGLITIVNDTVIKGGLNPLESGEFPYDVMPWQRRAGHWAGVGVCRQIRTPDRALGRGTAR